METSRSFRLRLASRDHHAGDAQCPGCEGIGEKSYPRPHRSYGTTCLGWVHAERVRDAANGALRTIYHCDVCHANPPG